MRYSLFIFLGLLFASFSCEKEELSLYASQEVLFARIQENDIREDSFQGWFIDNSGQIKGFSLSRNPALDWKGFTESGFNSKEEIYHNLMQSDTTFLSIPAGEIYKYYQLIEPASRGLLTEYENNGNITDKSSYFAIQYFPEEQKYRWVLLNSEGSVEVFNTTKEAEKITDWLREIDQLAVNYSQPE